MPNDDWFFRFIQDDREKLLECQRERMRFEREYNNVTYKALGERFGITAKMAWRVCNPAGYERSKLEARIYNDKHPKPQEKNVKLATASRSKKREFKKVLKNEVD